MVGGWPCNPSSSSMSSSRRILAPLMSLGPASSSASSHHEAGRSMLPWLEATEESLEGSHRWRRVAVYRGKSKALCRATFTDNGGQFWTPHNLLSILVPSLPSFVAEKIGTFSCAKRTSNLDSSQTELYFEVRILNLYSWWKIIFSDI